MKPLFLVFVLVFFVGHAQAQSSWPGYYITLKNDTVKAQIKVKKASSGDFNEEVEIVDEAKGLIRFLPTEVNGYGYWSGRYKYAFVSKPVKNGEIKFLSPAYVGPKSALYLYGTFATGGTFPSKKVFYTFEKSGNYLFLRNILNNSFRSELKEFYKDSAIAQQLIDTKFRYWLELDKDLVELMQKVNLN